MARADRLAEAVAERGLDQLIVADLVNPGDSGREAQADVFWLTGFTGTSALCVVSPAQRLFLTDFRYAERAERELDPAFDRVRIEGQPVAALAEHLRGRVGYDDARTSVRALRKLAEAVGEGVELVATDGILRELRRTKDDDEIARIAAAAELADAAYEGICERGLAGRTEREVALAAAQHMRELGAQAPAFPTIVAAGANGALPHHEASEHEIAAGELVIVDMGAIVDGYCSDCTRTFAAGNPDPEAAEVYELVRSTQATALEAIAPGVPGKAADAISREPIAAAGHGEHYGHGLGHGVGIEVHEAPRLSQRSEDELAEGDVVTVEPGVYVPGRLGVRIEDLVALTSGGARNLSSLSKELRVVG
ncbi:MAG: M24 family metallopeptidase [Solirubrobacterales bacterium]